MKAQLFDRDRLTIRTLAKRNHDLNISIIQKLKTNQIAKSNVRLKKIAQCILRSKEKQGAIIMMFGAHVLRSGVQNYIIDLMQRGYISCIALNGGGIIHDFELALIGTTTENVARYIKEGQFGLWKETARLNDIINEAYAKDKTVGMGEAIGRYIENFNFPDKSTSILAAGYRLGIPVTIHVGIGYDIIHAHPNCNGVSTGALSYNDFLKFASVVQNLEHGMIMNFGSAVMGPEVFLKALSMARNVAHQQGKEIRHFTSAVFDLFRLPKNIRKEPPRDEPLYYFRPWKTMLVRSIAGGGKSFYIRGKHAQTIPALWAYINKLEVAFGKGR